MPSAILIPPLTPGPSNAPRLLVSVSIGRPGNAVGVAPASKSGSRRAEWIWNLADLHFPGAIQIVDLYHAREHLWKLARALHPNDQVQQKRWMMYHQNRLDKGASRNW